MAFNASLEVIAMEPETVTFQGAVIRHPSSDKSVEVSGVIRFKYDSHYDDVYQGPQYIEHPFAISAGNSSIAYSKTLSWDLAGSISNDPERQNFEVHVQCLFNCEEANVTDQIMYYKDQGVTGFRRTNDIEFFGQDQRDDAYIVNLKLAPNYVLVEGRVNLPSGQNAAEDIPFRIFAERHTAIGYSSLDVFASFDYVIKKGDSGVNTNFRLTTPFFSTGYFSNLVSFAYECVSDACDRAGLLQEGWVGSVDADMFTEHYSALQQELEMINGDDDFHQTFSKPIEMLKQDNELNIIVSRPNLVKTPIQGKIVVEKVSYKKFCALTLSNGDSEFYLSDVDEYFVCQDSLWKTKRTLIFENDITIDSDELTKVVPFNFQTIINRLDTDFGYLSYQTIRFECDSGCDNTSLPKLAYLTENGKFSARFEGGAKKFYQTQDYLEADLLLNLVRPPLIMPMLELLMEEETTD